MLKNLKADRYINMIFVCINLFKEKVELESLYQAENIFKAIIKL